MARHLIFVDTESNGLDPTCHDLWEVSWWDLTTGERDTFLPFLPNVPRFLHDADLTALRVSRFVERWTDDYRRERGYGQGDTTARVGRLVDVLCPSRRDSDDNRAVIVAANPGHDAPFLRKLIRHAGYADTDGVIYHRMIDLGSYVAGVFGHDPADPLSAARAAELTRQAPGDHTAEGDVTSGAGAFLIAREIRAALRQGHTPSPQVWMNDHPLLVDVPHRLIEPADAAPRVPIVTAALESGLIPGTGTTLR